MFIAFILLHALGITMNMVVLFALILALGMLVDNGIVVVENIHRLYEEGLSPFQAAKQGVGEVAVPIIASTATTLAAFLPLIFWEGIIGEFMKYLPITLIIVLASSLFVALVITPVLTTLFVRKNTSVSPIQKKIRLSIILGCVALLCYFSSLWAVGNLCMLCSLCIPLHLFLLSPGAIWFQQVLLPKLEDGYYRLIRFSLRGRNPYLVLGGTVLLLCLSVFLLSIRAPKVLFFPESTPRYIHISIEKPIGTDIEATNQLTTVLEDEIMTLLQSYQHIVQSVIAEVGGRSVNEAKITIAFVPFEHRKGISTTQIMEEIRQRIRQYPGAEVMV